jgi:hypothetical protein
MQSFKSPGSSTQWEAAHFMNKLNTNKLQKGTCLLRYLVGFAFSSYIQITSLEYYIVPEKCRLLGCYAVRLL